VSTLLREQGIDSLIVEDAGQKEAATASAGVPTLVQAMTGGPEMLGAQLLAISGGEPDAALDLLRELDRELSLQRPPERQSAHRIVAQALLGTTRFHRAVQLEVVRALDEPFAISLSALWPALMLEDLAAAGGQEHSPERDSVLGALGQVREMQRGALPVEAVDRAEIKQARGALASTEDELRTHALRRLIAELPALDARKVNACLMAMEREFAGVERSEDQFSVLAELGALSSRLQDARSELARAALHRILTTQVRDRLAASLGQAIGPGHPLEMLARESPDEVMLLLLELVAEESRMHVRREIVTQLESLARGRIQLLTAHLVDPRWYIARNVVAVLGSVGDPEAVPYLRVALAHADARVRREALHALAQIRTPDAVVLMIQGLRHSDPETQQAAAHWLGMTDSSEAADALITLLHSSPLHEAIEVKRTAIRSLGRLGTPAAAAELRRIQSSGSLFTRRQVDELKIEAARALTSLREAQS
ncbi:MAG TPA: HEAT repeat domain-containing protein, partial [bacterium]|nr:HEAT repeat domain-containing protein [bacterium]